MASGVTDAETQTWEEFVETMEKDLWSVSRRFCQTVQRLRNGKCSVSQAVLGLSEELLN